MNDYSASREDAPLKSPDLCLRSVFKRIPRYTLITFIAAFVFGFLIHAFMFANKLPNHDDINHLFGSDYGTASGRWLLALLLHLDGEVSSPWLIGTLSVLCLSVSACLAGAVLRLRSTLSCILLAAVMVSFPTVGSTFTYMFSADAYFFSLMLACLAAFLTVKYRFGFFGGALAAGLSLGIYQSYLGVAAALLVCSLFIEILEGEATRSALFRIMRYLASLALGLGFYFLMVKLSTRSAELVDYMGISEMGKISVSELPRLIAGAYKSFYRFYIEDARGLYFGFMDAVFAFLAAASIILTVSLLRRPKLKALRVMTLLLLIAFLPLAGGMIYVMVPRAEVHELMIYGLSFFLIFPLTLYELQIKSTSNNALVNINISACWLIVASIALSVYNYGVHTNDAYMKMQLSYEQAASYSTRLLSAIESSENYDVNLTVVLVGKAFTDVQFKPSPELEEINMTGAINAESIINSYSYGYFLRYYMGSSNIIYATETTLSKTLSQNPVVEAMPSYPSRGSVAFVEGYIVVKLSGVIE